MSDSIKEIAFKNGQDAAFARPGSADNHPSFGLTKREYLAGQVASGFFSNSEIFQGLSDRESYVSEIVLLTDALLLELEKGNQ